MVRDATSFKTMWTSSEDDDDDILAPMGTAVRKKSMSASTSATITAGRKRSRTTTAKASPVLTGTPQSIVFLDGSSSSDNEGVAVEDSGKRRVTMSEIKKKTNTLRNTKGKQRSTIHLGEEEQVCPLRKPKETTAIWDDSSLDDNEILEIKRKSPSTTTRTTPEEEEETPAKTFDHDNSDEASADTAALMAQLRGEPIPPKPVAIEPPPAVVTTSFQQRGDVPAPVVAATTGSTSLPGNTNNDNDFCLPDDLGSSSSSEDDTFAFKASSSTSAPQRKTFTTKPTANPYRSQRHTNSTNPYTAKRPSCASIASQPLAFENPTSTKAAASPSPPIKSSTDLSSNRALHQAAFGIDIDDDEDKSVDSITINIRQGLRSPPPVWTPVIPALLRPLQPPQQKQLFAAEPQEQQVFASQLHQQPPHSTSYLEPIVCDSEDEDDSDNHIQEHGHFAAHAWQQRHTPKKPSSRCRLRHTVDPSRAGGVVVRNKERNNSSTAPWMGTTVSSSRRSNRSTATSVTSRPAATWTTHRGRSNSHKRHGGRGRGKGRGRGQRRTPTPIETGRRDDPNLQSVGGAEISF